MSGKTHRPSILRSSFSATESVIPISAPARAMHPEARRKRARAYNSPANCIAGDASRGGRSNFVRLLRRRSGEGADVQRRRCELAWRAIRRAEGCVALAGAGRHDSYDPVMYQPISRHDWV
jgi:hypothetical protein